MKRILSLVMALCLLCTVFAGCEGQTAPAAEPAAGGAPRDVLYIGEYDEEWVAADLIQGDTFYDLQMMMAEPLFLYNHDTGELEACLAEAPTFSEDGTVMTFVVPEGRKFPNGADLDAGDVVASLQHGITDGAMSDTFGIIKELSYEGNTVTLKLESYSTALLILLVSPFFCVIDSEQLKVLHSLTQHAAHGTLKIGRDVVNRHDQAHQRRLAIHTAAHGMITMLPRQSTCTEPSSLYCVPSGLP